MNQNQAKISSFFYKICFLKQKSKMPIIKSEVVGKMKKTSSELQKYSLLL